MPLSLQRSAINTAKWYPQKERHQFGEPVVAQWAREFSPHRFATESEERESNDKLKVRQVFWLLDEAGDQMEFLHLTLKGMLNNEIGSNFLRIAAKDYMHKGTTYASGALGGIMGGFVGGTAGGTAGGEWQVSLAPWPIRTRNAGLPQKIQSGK